MRTPPAQDTHWWKYQVIPSSATGPIEDLSPPFQTDAPRDALSFASLESGEQVTKKLEDKKETVIQTPIIRTPETVLTSGPVNNKLSPAKNYKTTSINNPNNLPMKNYLRNFAISIGQTANFVAGDWRRRSASNPGLGKLFALTVNRPPMAIVQPEHLGGVTETETFFESATEIVKSKLGKIWTKIWNRRDKAESNGRRKLRESQKFFSILPLHAESNYIKRFPP